MSDRVVNSLLAAVIVTAALICGIGIASAIATSAKGGSQSIDESMIQLEKLYDELYEFQRSPNYLENGYGTTGRGKWSDEVLRLDKDKKLRTYIETILPEKILFTWPFHTVQPARPYHLWVTGRVYYRTGGEETGDTLIVKDQFKKLFKLHKSRKK